MCASADTDVLETRRANAQNAGSLLASGAITGAKLATQPRKIKALQVARKHLMLCRAQQTKVVAVFDWPDLGRAQPSTRANQLLPEVFLVHSLLVSVALWSHASTIHFSALAGALNITSTNFSC